MSTKGQDVPCLDYDWLDAYYDEFVKYVEQQSGGAKFGSFATHPYIDEQENYKYQIHQEARRRLAFGDWKKRDIGSGEIIDRVISAFEINTEDLRNNLVQQDRRWGESRRDQQALYEAKKAPSSMIAFEELLCSLFRNEIEDVDAFERILELAGKKYGFVAYLFFLKDWSRYLPIAPDTFDTAFKMLGADFKTSRQCSWENYSTFNELIAEVRDFLNSKLDSEVNLLDAHSFLWIMARPPKLTIEEVEAEYLEYTPKATLSPKRPTTGRTGKIDYVKRQQEQMIIGRQAEDIVLRYEKDRLRRLGKHNLADQVTNVADDPSFGYDILSYEESKQERQIEVKAVKTTADGKTFFLTENELNVSKSSSASNYYLYLVTKLKSERPKILAVKHPDFRDDDQFNLEVVNYRVWIE